MEIVQSDSLEFLRKIPDFENDIVFADPPYNLGSEVTITKEGKVDYSKKSEFMDKWSALDGPYWENWFKESFRTLKHFRLLAAIQLIM